MANKHKLKMSTILMVGFFYYMFRFGLLLIKLSYSLFILFLLLGILAESFIGLYLALLSLVVGIVLMSIGFLVSLKIGVDFINSDFLDEKMQSILRLFTKQT